MKKNPKPRVAPPCVRECFGLIGTAQRLCLKTAQSFPLVRSVLSEYPSRMFTRTADPPGPSVGEELRETRRRGSPVGVGTAARSSHNNLAGASGALPGFLKRYVCVLRRWSDGPGGEVRCRFLYLYAVDTATQSVVNTYFRTLNA